MPGLRHDQNYIMQLVRRGRIEIYIDGLNEVEASVREAISQFMEKNPTAKIIVSTQPMRWVRPTIASARPERAGSRRLALKSGQVEEYAG
jgi:hypothetical protein